MRLSSIETPSGRRCASSGVVRTPSRSAATGPLEGSGVGAGAGAAVPAMGEGVTSVVGGGPSVGRTTAVGLQDAIKDTKVMAIDRIRFIRDTVALSGTRGHPQKVPVLTGPHS